jgi:hypothetical protein
MSAHRRASELPLKSRPSGSTGAMTPSSDASLVEHKIEDTVIAKKRTRCTTTATKWLPKGLRWPVERTNSWLSNFGQPRRNTDGKPVHWLAQFVLAVLLTAKLIDWRNR